MDLRKRLGNSGEDRAAAFLKKRGYRIVERNWRHALGEIDLVAADRDVLVFVEVRTRASGLQATPEDSVTLT
ncbi:MAG: YraN family protein, partial [Chloroflexota bacterium]|nr:YraN family protein [Chloroflexota bacterium]